MEGMNPPDYSQPMSHEHMQHVGHAKLPPLNLSAYSSTVATDMDYSNGYNMHMSAPLGGHDGHSGHDAHNAHSDHGSGPSSLNTHEGHGLHNGHSMMSMTFHGGVDETILFSWWKVSEAGEFVGSFFAIFLMALLYEGLKYYRKHLLWKTYNGLQYCAVAPPDKGVANICAPDEPQVIQPVQHALEPNVPTMLSTAHAWQTALHGVQVLVSYMLMLVFMTYNTWLCAAVVLGSATGYFLFGWRESVVVDFTEHCH